MVNSDEEAATALSVSNALTEAHELILFFSVVSE